MDWLEWNISKAPLKYYSVDYAKNREVEEQLNDTLEHWHNTDYFNDESFLDHLNIVFSPTNETPFYQYGNLQFPANANYLGYPQSTTNYGEYIIKNALTELNALMSVNDRSILHVVISLLHVKRNFDSNIGYMADYIVTPYIVGAQLEYLRALTEEDLQKYATTKWPLVVN
jgi:hypothetical protein